MQYPLHTIAVTLCRKWWALITRPLLSSLHETLANISVVCIRFTLNYKQLTNAWDTTEHESRFMLLAWWELNGLFMQALRLLFTCLRFLHSNNSNWGHSKSMLHTSGSVCNLYLNGTRHFFCIIWCHIMRRCMVFRQ